jgi:hypothetical protein
MNLFPPVSFRLVSHWRVPGTPDAVAAILTRPEDFPRWWGDVYLAVTPLRPGDDQGIGKTVAIHSKGWLPYRLHWQATLTDSQMPDSWSIEAKGDLTGRGTWTLQSSGPDTLVTYDWRVTSDRLLFRLLGPLLKGLMVSNHTWAMARGEAGLRAELRRNPPHAPFTDP